MYNQNRSAPQTIRFVSPSPKPLSLSRETAKCGNLGSGSVHVISVRNTENSTVFVRLCRRTPLSTSACVVYTKDPAIAFSNRRWRFHAGRYKKGRRSPFPRPYRIFTTVVKTTIPRQQNVHRDLGDRVCVRTIIFHPLPRVRAQQYLPTYSLREYGERFSFRFVCRYLREISIGKRYLSQKRIFSRVEHLSCWEKRIIVFKYEVERVLDARIKLNEIHAR